MARRDCLRGAPCTHSFFLIFLMAVIIAGHARSTFSAAAGEPTDATLATLKAVGVSVTPAPGGGNTLSFGWGGEEKPITEDAWKAIESIQDVRGVGIAHRYVGIEEIRRLCKIESIETFFISGWKGGMSCGEGGEMAAIVAQLPNLRQCGFSHFGIVGKQAAKLGDFEKCSKLTKFGLPMIVSDEGMKAVGRLSQLKHIHANSSLSSFGIAQIGKLYNLETLYLRQCHNPSWTFRDFRHLSGLKNLRELSLDEAVLAYEDGLEHLKGLNLTKLKITNSFCSAEDVAKLQAAMPGTKIEVSNYFEDGLKHWNDAVARKKNANKGSTPSAR